MFAGAARAGDNKKCAGSRQALGRVRGRGASWPGSRPPPRRRRRPRDVVQADLDRAHARPALDAGKCPFNVMATSSQYCQLLSDYGPPSLGYTQGAGNSQVPQRKYAELLALSEELGEEIGPTYAVSKSAMERHHSCPKLGSGSAWLKRMQCQVLAPGQSAGPSRYPVERGFVQNGSNFSTTVMKL